MKNKNLKKEINKMLLEKKYNYILATVFSKTTKKSPEESLEIVNKIFENAVDDIEKKFYVINKDIDTKKQE